MVSMIPFIVSADKHYITESHSKSLSIILYKNCLECMYKILNGQINSFHNLNSQLDLVKNKKKMMLMTL